MGRCYEFGVLVGEGCQHAMVVPPGGGHCHCETCGVQCTGKFAACTAIIAQPGYVPTTAPAWAVARADPGPRVAPPEPSTVPAPAGPQNAMDLTELVEGVSKQLAEHDTDLATRLDALAEQIDELQRQSAQLRAMLQVAVAQLANVVKRVEAASRPAPLFGFSRRTQDPSGG